MNIIAHPSSKISDLLRHVLLLLLFSMSQSAQPMITLINGDSQLITQTSSEQIFSISIDFSKYTQVTFEFNFSNLDNTQSYRYYVLVKHLDQPYYTLGAKPQIYITADTWSLEPKYGGNKVSFSLVLDNFTKNSQTVPVYVKVIDFGSFLYDYPFVEFSYSISSTFSNNSFSYCPRNCSGNGVCVNSWCECNAPYTGNDCQILATEMSEQEKTYVLKVDHTEPIFLQTITYETLNRQDLDFFSAREAVGEMFYLAYTRPRFSIPTPYSYDKNFSITIKGNQFWAKPDMAVYSPGQRMVFGFYNYDTTAIEKINVLTFVRTEEYVEKYNHSIEQINKGYQLRALIIGIGCGALCCVFIIICVFKCLTEITFRKKKGIAADRTKVFTYLEEMRIRAEVKGLIYDEDKLICFLTNYNPDVP